MYSMQYHDTHENNSNNITDIRCKFAIRGTQNGFIECKRLLRVPEDNLIVYYL